MSLSAVTTTDTTERYAWYVWRVRRIAQALALLVLLGGCGRKEKPQAGAAPSASAVHAAPEPKVPAELSLFYSSNTRGSGELARRATLVDRARIESGSVVQVDAGDMTAAGSARLTIASYQRMGVDVITPGEQELVVEPDKLKKILSVTDVAVVAANLADKKGEHPFASDKLVTAGARTIGVFGILDVALGSTEWALSDPIAASRQAVESLRARGAALVVGLLHVEGGVAKAKEILAEVPDIDVVVLGHRVEGSALGKMETIGRTRIVQADGSDGRVGRLDIRSLAAKADYVDEILEVPSSIPEHVGVDLLFQLDREPAKEPSTIGADGKTIFENWTYGSNGACVLCHPKEAAQWSTTDHAHALASLKKGGHDQDRECLGCHTTGYLLPGGTRRVKTAIEQFSEVGCECCHGASVKHIRATNKKKGTMRAVSPALCLGCHTIDRNGDLFDAVGAMKQIIGPGHGMP
jgi:hypothetical protein